MNSAKAFTIPKALIMEAYQDVKKSKGGSGADGQTMEEFEGDLKNQLYKIGIVCRQEAIFLHPSCG